MPLRPMPKNATEKDRDKVIQDNIERLVKEGKHPEHAAAIAYSVAESSSTMAHILPAHDLFDGEKVIPLGDPKFFTQVVNSLSEWVKTRKPNILVEHNRDGQTLGEVRQIISDHRGIFAELVFNPDSQRKLNEGKFKYVSPTIVWNHKADDFSQKGSWPASLLEVSVVSVPRHSQQIPMTHTSEFSESGVIYGEGTFISQMSSFISESETYFIEEDINMDLEKLQELFGEMLEEHLEPLRKRLEGLEAKAEGEPKEEVEEAEKDEAKADQEEGEAKGDLERAEESEMQEEVKEEEEVVEKVELEEDEDEKESKMSEASDDDVLRDLTKRALVAESRVAELEAVIARRDAQDIVAQDIADKPHMSSMSEKLVNIYLNDKDLYTEVVSIVPQTGTSVLSERVTVGIAPASSKPGNKYAAATELVKKEKISYREALERVQK